MLAEISLFTLVALATAIPVDFLGRPILPVLPRDILTNTLGLRQDNVIKEVVPGVYICTGKHWTGNCYWEDRAAGYCHKYNLGTASSFGPDVDAVCQLYMSNNCQGVGVAVAYPGLGDGLKGNVQSWKCD